MGGETACCDGGCCCGTCDGGGCGITVVEIDCNGDEEIAFKAFADGNNAILNNTTRRMSEVVFCRRLLLHLLIFLGMDYPFILNY